MERKRCNLRTKRGQPCQRVLRAGHCYYHGEPEAPSTADDDSSPPRDLAGAGWWVVRGVASERLTPSQAQAITSALRVVRSAPPSPLDEDRMLAIGQLRGRLFHGIPPATEAEWQLAEEIFDAAAVEELRRWEALLERDRGDDR